MQLEGLVDEKAPPLTDDRGANHQHESVAVAVGLPVPRLRAGSIGGGASWKTAPWARIFIDRGKVTERALEYVWDQFRGLQNIAAAHGGADRGHDITGAIDRAVKEEFPKGDEAWLQQHRDIERGRLEQADPRVAGCGTQARGLPQRQTSAGTRVQDRRTQDSRPRRPHGADQRRRIRHHRLQDRRRAYSPTLVGRPASAGPATSDLCGGATALKDTRLPASRFAMVRPASATSRARRLARRYSASGRTDGRYGEFATTIESWQPELERLARNFLGRRCRGRSEVPAGAVPKARAVSAIWFALPRQRKSRRLR